MNDSISLKGGNCEWLGGGRGGSYAVAFTGTQSGMNTTAICQKVVLVATPLQGILTLL